MNGHGYGPSKDTDQSVQRQDIEERKRSIGVSVSDDQPRSDPSVPPSGGRCLLLELPGEILSQIASYLPLSNLVPFLSLHPLLLSLTRSHLSPIPPSIRSILSSPPYPQTLAVIPHLPHFLPPDKQDAERLFVQILVRARPRWILERFEYARWDERIWQDAFERRFLRSWKRLKGDDDSWRAVFLRTLGKLEHRLTGCTHEEAWTRFVTLHRNGSASINRMYSRTFDPYEIYDELKHQNNFSSQPTSVRVVLHLQDVRILAFGVLVDQPSLFVNPNAHLALHPPLLRHLSLPPDVDSDTIAGSRYYRSSEQVTASRMKGKAPSASPSGGPNEAYFPLVRSMSPSSPRTTSYGLSMAENAVSSFGAAAIPIVSGGPSAQTASTSAGSSASPPQTPSGSSLRSTLASYIPITGRRRTSSSAAEQTLSGSGTSQGHGSTAPTSSSLGAVLTLVRSRDSDDGSGRRRTWSLGRARAGSTSTINNLLASASAEGGSGSNQASSRIAESATPEGSGLASSAAVSGPSAGLPALTEVPSPVDEQSTVIRATSTNGHKVEERPYDTLEKPQPALSHMRYPNFTPRPDSVDSKPSALASPDEDEHQADGVKHTSDLRSTHPEVDDEYEGGLWGGDVSWGHGGMRMAEWDEEIGKRRRWVGPMILVAQLHPPTKPTPHPSSVPPTAPLEGANPDLGPKGMYASLGFEDIEAIFPWVELKSSGAWNGESRRSGLGF
ncbi:hypothetical protein I317_03503 [Kwoniella heveanensis CBS 569]|nr:hypothetical protein I317_03503 [Kwoniella heveanensis CBS 569]